MRTYLFNSFLLLSLALLLSCDSSDSPAPDLNVLVFSKTAGYRHASIADGQQMLRNLADEHGFKADFTENAAHFTEENLSNYRVVIFLNTTGNVLDAAQQDALEGFIRGGGGFVGIHAATDTEYGWSWYNGLVGAQFASHPKIQEATIIVEDDGHPATEHLPGRWVRTDEWYNFKNLQSGLNVLMRLDESTYNGGTHGDEHPISWYRSYDGGRAFYTALGHTPQSYREPEFVQHVWGGIRYAAGMGR